MRMIHGFLKFLDFNFICLHKNSNKRRMYIRKFNKISILKKIFWNIYMKSKELSLGELVIRMLFSIQNFKIDIFLFTINWYLFERYLFITHITNILLTYYRWSVMFSLPRKYIYKRRSTQIFLCISSGCLFFLVWLLYNLFTSIKLTVCRNAFAYIVTSEFYKYQFSTCK